MEALRMKGNGLFHTHPEQAAIFYLEALDLYDQHADALSPARQPFPAPEAGGVAPGCTLEEYTKCAGNALTCLYQTGQTEACLGLANRVLRVNPILAKANAFIGRCLLEHPEVGTYPGPGAPFLRTGVSPFLYFCRALLQLPALRESVQPYLSAAVDQLQLQYARGGGTREQGGAVERVKPMDLGTEKGRGVLATASIAPLTTVSDTRQAFSAACYEETQGRGCCLSCGQSIAPDGEDVTAEEAQRPPSQRHGGNAPEACPVCELAYYCSNACAEAHRGCHDLLECARLGRLKEVSGKIAAQQIDAPEGFYELAYHTITTLAAMKLRREGYERVLDLASHAEEVSQALHPLVPLVHSLMPEEDVNLVAKLVGILRCNALEVVDASGLGVGQVLDCVNLTSLFNHSCAPNCALKTRGACPAIVTTRAIAKDEELTISYIPQLYWPRKLRQDALRERYFFTCRCARCEGAARDPFERAIQMERAGARYKDATEYFCGKVLATCTELRSLSIDEVAMSHVQRLLDLLGEIQKDLYPFHYLCHEIRNTLTFLYAVLNKPRECLGTCLEELLMWEGIVPGALPVKQMKLQNALKCLTEMMGRKGFGGGDGTGAPVLLDYIEKLALTYEVETES